MTLRPCRECGEDVSTEAEACPNCGAPHPTYRRGQDDGDSGGCFTVFLLLIPFTLVVAVLITVFSPTYSETGNGIGDSADCSAIVGDIARIETDGDGPVYVGRTETALNEFLEALSAEDRFGFKKLLQSGRVIRVNNATSVRVLERNISIAEVRIQEGPYRGEAGWVLDESLRC